MKFTTWAFLYHVQANFQKQYAAIATIVKWLFAIEYDFEHIDNLA